MFEYIRGTLVETHLTKVIVDVQGLGYEIWTPFSLSAKLSQIGQEVKLYTTLVIREDSHKLYGFLLHAERDLFNQLNELSGIGPKTALALIGHLELSGFHAAVAQENLSLICKVPGVGKKTAERLIVDMRGKLKNIDLSADTEAGSLPEKSSTAADAIHALVHLGYNTLQAQKAVRIALKESKEPLPLAKVITLALKNI